MSLARDLIDRVFHPDRDVHAIPTLDGGFAPNQRLEEAEQLAEFQAPDALALGDGGALYVSSGSRVFVCRGERFHSKRVFAEFDAPVGALAWSDGVLVAAVAEHGVRVLAADGTQVAELAQAGGAPLRCPTAVTVARDGTIYIADGSRHNGPEQWLQDLMQAGPPSGRLIAWRAGKAEADVLHDGLAWPAGVALTQDQTSVLVSEAWAHRLSAVARAGGALRVLVRNFAGYPGRIARAPAGDRSWVAFFALRSQLTEFVLREPGFRARMMAQVPPALWIGPTLGGRFDVREPTQIGRIKKLGIQKPWAPARSYGLVACLDDAGSAIESLHSRAAGTLHGITGAIQQGDRLLVVSKGHGKLATARLAAR
jgi:hypothetical protein